MFAIMFTVIVAALHYCSPRLLLKSPDGLPASSPASSPCSSDCLSKCCLHPDPHHDDLYLNASSFLALINGERDHPNATGETPGFYLGVVFCFSDRCVPPPAWPGPRADSGSLAPKLQHGGRTSFAWAAWCWSEALTMVSLPLGSPGNEGLHGLKIR